MIDNSEGMSTEMPGEGNNTYFEYYKSEIGFIIKNDALA